MPFRIKNPPKKPVRQKEFTRSVSLDFVDGLAGLIAYADEWGVDPAECKIVASYDYSSNYYHMTWTGEEPDYEYGKRVASYNKKLEEYEKWYQENKEEVDREIERREKKQTLKTSKEIERLEKQLAQLRKKK